MRYRFVSQKAALLLLLIACAFAYPLWPSPSSRRKAAAAAVVDIGEAFASSKPNDDKGTTKLARLRGALLPIGWPSSVPPEYLQYQFYNIIQDACSYLRGIMSMSALLAGMGVGNAEVTAVQATVLWILKDGAGMLGGLLFASLWSGTFGQNVKTWRLFADFINNVGLSLEVAAPIFTSNKKAFGIIICLASIFKALCGIAAGSANAAILEHWGRENGNIGDVAAKSGAQHTLVSLACLSISVPFARFASATPARVCAIYSFLTLAHMLANMQALRVLALSSLNRSRFELLLSRFFTKQSLSKRDIAKVEPIISLLFNGETKSAINRNLFFFASPELLKSRLKKESIQRGLEQYQYIKPRRPYIIFQEGDLIFVLFEPLARPLDHAKALFDAFYASSSALATAATATDSTHREQLFESFWREIKENGWDVERISLAPTNKQRFFCIQES